MFKKIINNGVLHESSFTVQNKIRIFNVAIVIIGLLHLIFLAISFLQQNSVLNFIFIGYMIFLLCMFLLIHIGKSLAALHTMMVSGLAYVFLVCIFLGAKAEFQVIYFVFIISAVVFGSKKYTFYYFLASIACMVTVKIMYLYFEPLFPDALLAKSGIFNLVFAGVLIYLSMERFRAELAKNHKKLSQKNKIIESQQQKIIDSINYAKHIQQSILVGEAEMQKIFPDSFIYYHPKDIVSGDFYWLSEIKMDSGNLFVLAVADCTGHGVPGAFLSMIGNMLLNKIVNEKHILQPSLILNELNKDILASLHHGNNPNASEDGMDIAVCTIDPAKQVMEYAGALSPVYILQKTGDRHLERIPSDNKSIGGSMGISSLSPEFPFTNHKISFERGTTVYLFSDGYMDQFGSEQKRKIGSERFKNILAEGSHLSMPEQKENLARTFNSWKGSHEQMDDVLVMGIKL